METGNGVGRAIFVLRTPGMCSSVRFQWALNDPVCLGLKPTGPEGEIRAHPSSLALTAAAAGKCGAVAVRS